MDAKLALVSLTFLFLSYNTKSSDFLDCMTTYEEHLYSRSSSEYPSLFFSQQQNARWLNTSTSKPSYIFTPDKEIEIQKAVLCSQKHGLQIRVKSGGHDYEGQSFFSHVPYIIIELHRFRSISINIDE